ncbi:peptidyl-prolyl cis-trans isomerase [Roseateles cellulosilyticus]|uniref:Peptidyl-prolyl cis-trans isomerase n=1 Tax=Pelomonas cellulosilytica TaxID=2906762 RepID=A0ABS8XTZ4_9BURK|nr:peptidylprolyl isomerase [Pelomonas sp. P8]MCE4555170.1 peptidyl-prolyl cis-trans isomerase [Pelomonas sp. P8]
MSAQLPLTSATTQAPPHRPGLPGWTREPLLHFVLLGAALFGADRLVNGAAGSAQEIVVGADVQQEARELFKAQRGREPSAEEMAALRKVWLDNEVLYREGLALQLDKGDTAIRERVIFKALSVVDGGTKLPPVSDTVLRSWFEKHREKYDEPERFDFQEAVLEGNPDEAAVRAFVNQLNNGTPGDAKAGLRVFKGRPHGNLVQSYGDDFAKTLEKATPGQWLALGSREGWRAVRLDSTSPAKPGNFDALRGVVLQDWTDATLAEQRSAAVAALAKKYTIKVEATAQ